MIMAADIAGVPPPSPVIEDTGVEREPIPSLYKDTKYWVRVRASDFAELDWSGLEGTRVAFPYDKGSRPGKWREVDYVEGMNGRLRGIEVNGDPKIKTYYLRWIAELAYAVRGRVPGSDGVFSASREDAGRAWGADLVALLQGASSAFASFPPEQMVYNPTALALMEMCLKKVVRLVRAGCYTIDNLIASVLAARLRRGGLSCYLVLDKGQCVNPSCSTQRAAMLTLKEWGAHMRVRRPTSGMTSAQHEKTWLFDNELLWVGSANATRNSFHKCEEASVVTKSEVLIQAQADHFDLVWEDSDEIDWKALAAKEQDVLETRARSRSLSRPR
jgi:hypothetical protein